MLIFSMESQLVLISQDALSRDRINKNGVCREAHIVCKNLPFSIELETRKIEVTSKTSIECELLHDFTDDSETERPVEHIQSAPMECRVHINSKSSFVVECRIKTLTSQLQSLFRVKITVSNSSSSRTVVYSNAIKVISKAPQAPSKNAQSHPRKTANETIHEMLGRLEQQNRENEDLLKQMLGGSSSVSSTASSPTISFDFVNASPLDFTSSPISPSSFSTSPLPTEQDDFQDAFQRFITSYRSIEPEERPRKIRKMLTSISPSDVSIITEFIGFVPSSNSPSTQAPFQFYPPSSCDDYSCPHKRELDRVNSVYDSLAADLISI